MAFNSAINADGPQSRISTSVTSNSTFLYEDAIMNDLFDALAGSERETLAEGAVLLRGKALPFEADLLANLDVITAAAPFRQNSVSLRSE
jgi:hypothetical protein